MIASAQTIRKLAPVSPLVEKSLYKGMSYGLSHCGYDIRIDGDMALGPGAFGLTSAIEYFKMPRNLVGVVHDKSTWARQGLTVQNTVIEPGWQGYLTIELVNHSQHIISLWNGMPIAQVVFHLLDEPTEIPYEGKYQNQERGGQEARFERT